MLGMPLRAYILNCTPTAWAYTAAQLSPACNLVGFLAKAQPYTNLPKKKPTEV